jgi:hypothetical protein
MRTNAQAKQTINAVAPDAGSFRRVTAIALGSGTAFFLLIAALDAVWDTRTLRTTLAPGYHTVRYLALLLMLKTGHYPGFGSFEDVPTYILSGTLDIFLYSFVALIPLVIFRFAHDTFARRCGRGSQ